MKTIMIAPLGGRAETIFIGVREFPTEKVILIPEDGKLKEVEKIKADLEKFKIPVEVEELKDSKLESMFEVINHIRKREKGKQLAINLGPASKMMSCGATAAAFVNGIKAFDVSGDEILPLPVLNTELYLDL